MHFFVFLDVNFSHVDVRTPATFKHLMEVAGLEHPDEGYLSHVSSVDFRSGYRVDWRIRGRLLLGVVLLLTSIMHSEVLIKKMTPGDIVRAVHTLERCIPRSVELFVVKELCFAVAYVRTLPAFVSLRLVRIVTFL